MLKRHATERALAEKNHFVDIDAPSSAPARKPGIGARRARSGSAAILVRAAVDRPRDVRGHEFRDRALRAREVRGCKSASRSWQAIDCIIIYGGTKGRSAGR